MPRPRKTKGPKRVQFSFIERDSAIGHQLYPMLRDCIASYHSELQGARIGLAWALGWRPDVDGRLKVGMCRRASDLDRELSDFDFVILLNRPFWQHPSTTIEQRVAILDHELCHATVKLDPRTGEPVTDERGRTVWRLRRHDLEEFAEVVRRHGTYKRDIELFAAALRQADAKADFTPCDTCRDGGSPGYMAVLDDGVPKVKRCQCWLEWSERRRQAKAA